MAVMSAAQEVYGRSEFGFELKGDFSMSRGEVHTSLAQQAVANTDLIDVGEHGEFDTFDLSPWQQSLRSQFIVLIDSGNFDGALNLLERNLEFSSIRAEGTLEALDSALNYLSHTGAQDQVVGFLQKFADSGLAADIYLSSYEMPLGLGALDRKKIGPVYASGQLPDGITADTIYKSPNVGDVSRLMSQTGERHMRPRDHVPSPAGMGMAA